MALFRFSQLAISAAVTEIADSAGASADVEMQNRAWRSLNAGIKYFNGRHDWRWLLTEGTPISVAAPFNVAFMASAGLGSATAAAGHGLEIDDFLVGSGFGLGTRVTATATTALGFTPVLTAWVGTATANATANRDFYDLPTDFRKPYTVKLLTSRRVLLPAPRRAYDRATYDEFVTGMTEWYDLFAGSQKGKIRLLPPPASADKLLIRYSRIMATASASASTATLDIPSDYDFHLISWAKFHFLTDKGQPERATTWLQMANEGLKTMIADGMVQPDESLAFGDRSNTWSWDSTSTRYLPWDYT